MTEMKTLTAAQIRQIMTTYKTLGILGKKGSGKSVVIASCADALPEVIVFDMLGVYNPEAQYKTAVIPKSRYYENPTAFINKFDNSKLKKHVINFSAVKPSELIAEADKICEFILNHAKKTTGKLYVLVDEVADIAPERGKISDNFHFLVKNGRNYGIFVIMASQRPQGVDKSVLELCDGYLLSGQNGNRTIEEIVKITNSEDRRHTETILRELPERTFLFVHENENEPYKIPTYKNAFKQH
ncbi:hypothetical protein MmiEs2_09050 [Methanimicrococcus stummii]|uniref:DNA helicase n=2 Tax=Methanimicrococcus stummii TaxID=3028294 RepID=A0AA96ZZ03_9EURY|nr:hypothetical protein MmiEs2_09050 [Methanimicrococcus sp. Es2]